MWIIKIIKIQCFKPPRILNEHWGIYSCLQIPPRENWFQYYAEYTQLQLTFLGLHSWTQYFFYTTHFPYLQLMLSFRKLMFLIIQPLLDDYLDVFLWHFGTVKIPRSLAAVSAKGREQVMQRRQSKVWFWWNLNQRSIYITLYQYTVLVM